MYQIIREYEGWSNWSMIIVEKCPCEDSYNSRKIERFYFEQLKATLNSYRPLITAEEKKQEDKERKQTEQFKEYNKFHSKQYREDNKEKIYERRSEKITCSCGSLITKLHKARHEQSFKHISKSQSLFKPTDEIIHA